MRTFVLDAVESTNGSALEFLAQGHQAPFLVQAQAQTGGRGRGGKPWASPPGNFYGTFVIDPDQGNTLGKQAGGHAAQLSFVAALALANVLHELGIAAQLKWPNDVLIDGAKVSGILLEKHQGKNGAHILIGMGVNLASHPDLPTYASTSLSEQGHPLTPDDFGRHLARNLAVAVAAWQAQGFAPIRAAWLERAWGLGAAMTAHLPGEKNLDGHFQGLDSDGALLLRTQVGVTTIHAGDIYFHAAGD